MSVRGRRVVLGILAFALLYLIALAFSIPKIENNLTDNVTQQLVAGGVTGVAVSFSGRDGTLSGPLATKDAKAPLGQAAREVDGHSKRAHSMDEAGIEQQDERPLAAGG